MINSTAFDYVNVLTKAADASWKRESIITNNISNVDNSRSSTKIVKVPNTDTNSYIEIIGLFIIVGALLFIVKLKIFYEK